MPDWDEWHLRVHEANFDFLRKRIELIDLTGAQSANRQNWDIVQIADVESLEEGLNLHLDLVTMRSNSGIGIDLTHDL